MEIIPRKELDDIRRELFKELTIEQEILDEVSELMTDEQFDKYYVSLQMVAEIQAKIALDLREFAGAKEILQASRRAARLIEAIKTQDPEARIGSTCLTMDAFEACGFVKGLRAALEAHDGASTIK